MPLDSQCFFFFNDTATTEIYTLSLHDALPISRPAEARSREIGWPSGRRSSLRRPQPCRPSAGVALDFRSIRPDHPPPELSEARCRRCERGRGMAGAARRPRAAPLQELLDPAVL